MGDDIYVIWEDDGSFRLPFFFYVLRSFKNYIAYLLFYTIIFITVIFITKLQFQA